MNEFKVLEIILFICTLQQIAQSVPVEKWHKTDDFPTFFIEEENEYNWFEAWNECASKNMTLVAVDTPEKNLALTAILQEKFGKSPNLWIGGHDLGEHDQFFWSSTGKRFEFTNWSKGNPNHWQDNETCVHYYDVTDFEWNDAKCDDKMGFICEENRFLLTTRKDLAVKKNFIDQLFSL